MEGALLWESWGRQWAFRGQPRRVLLLRMFGILQSRRSLFRRFRDEFDRFSGFSYGKPPISRAHRSRKSSIFARTQNLEIFVCTRVTKDSQKFCITAQHIIHQLWSQHLKIYQLFPTLSTLIILLTLITIFEILLILSHIVHFDHSAHSDHNIWNSAHSFPPCPLWHSAHSDHKSDLSQFRSNQWYYLPSLFGNHLNFPNFTVLWLAKGKITGVWLALWASQWKCCVRQGHEVKGGKILLKSISCMFHSFYILYVVNKIILKMMAIKFLTRNGKKVVYFYIFHF